MEENILDATITKDVVSHSPKKILFANFPADGHFNPLTGLAMYLKNIGYDVRWYTSKTYAQKLKKLNITHYPFKQAMEVIDNNFDEAFPERTKIKSQVKKLVFDMIHAFILRAPEYYADMLEIRRDFAFDMVICDCAFTAIPFIKEKINVPVVSVGVFPLTETSKDLAPMGLGLTPANSFTGRMKQTALRFIADKILFAKATKVCKELLNDHGIETRGSNMFDILVHSSTLLLQSGTPGFEYKRSDLGKNIKFIGAVLPYLQKSESEKWYDGKLGKYKKIILVTQGTVEKDTSKLIEPTLQTFKNTDHLVIVTTGGSGTEFLRKKYNCENFIIEDFIPFTDVMPYADVYITNGGYGGVMLSIQNKLPMIVAGVHEGKNEISARVGYFNLGINLRTETPVPSQIKHSVEKILNDETYLKNIKQLCKEFSKYNSNELCAAYVRELFNKQNSLKKGNAYHYINN
jgi:MGT family glycosyltransferase